MNFDECDELFEGIRDPSVSMAEKAGAIHDLFMAHQVLSYEMGRGNIFWRARFCEPPGFDEESELFHPPAERTNEGRLNDGGAPVLYLSARAETAVAEIRAVEGDHVQLAGFRIRPDKTLRIVALGDIDHVIRTGRLRTLGADPDNAIQRSLNQLPESTARIWQYIDAFLAGQLAAREKACYPITRTIAQEAYRRTRASAMFYPSVQYDAGMNLAVPEAHVNRMELVASRVMRIGKVRSFGFFDREVVRQAQTIDQDGRFLWAPNVEGDRGYVFRLTEAEFNAGRDGEVTLLDLPTEQALGPSESSDDLYEAVHRGLHE